MAANDNLFVKILDEDYFNAERSLSGDNLNLSPKCTGTLNLKGNIKINGETPGTAGGAIVKDSNGNVNLGPDKGANKNIVTGDNNVATGMHNTVSGEQDLISGNNNTLGTHSLNSAIIGGQNNINDKVGSVILGGYNQTAYEDNTVYTPDLKVNGNISFGMGVFMKRYGEFNISVDTHEQRSLSHPLGTRTGGMYKLMVKGTSGIKVTIYEDEYTLDGTWQEFLTDVPNGALLVEFDGDGTVSYIMEIFETNEPTE